MIVVSRSMVQSQAYQCRPNGTLIGKGTVSYFENKHADNVYNPIVVTNIFIDNENGVSFFQSPKLSVQSMRGVAKALMDMATEAEAAHKQLLEINSEKKLAGKVT
jgi:hypothetical protein